MCIIPVAALTVAHNAGRLLSSFTQSQCTCCTHASGMGGHVHTSHPVCHACMRPHEGSSNTLLFQQKLPSGRSPLRVTANTRRGAHQESESVHSPAATSLPLRQASDASMRSGIGVCVQISSQRACACHGCSVTGRELQRPGTATMHLMCVVHMYFNQIVRKEEGQRLRQHQWLAAGIAKAQHRKRP